MAIGFVKMMPLTSRQQMEGWKLPDMMFATRRDLSDACNTVAKQLENVYSSVAATKKLLSSRIDRVDCSLDECAELTAATREEVSELRGEMKGVGVDVQSVHHAVPTLAIHLCLDILDKRVVGCELEH
ncbi:uncharacterized protein LOC130773034 [Actinidia eriantha]|uniref:uncharacterized protein LOC130773034 n=1 Tax=Actinidia eriantha TaxID=165200 RepID=UPI00258EFA38|nr:uncharacterized protein LOC130773034 [Actinidia eriantha]